MMTMKKRSGVINGTERALKALGERASSSQKELDHDRDDLNACYSHDSDSVWNSVTNVEVITKLLQGAPSAEERRSDPATAAALEEPATATRGRHAEDLACGRHRRASVEMQRRLTTRHGTTSARPFDQWLVIKVGDEPRLTATSAQPNRGPSPEHITGRAKRTPARRAGSLACVVPVGGSAYGTSNGNEHRAHCGLALDSHRSRNDVSRPSALWQPR